MKIIVYTRVSTAEQSQSGAGLEAPRKAILSEVDRRGWELVDTFEDSGFTRSLGKAGSAAGVD